MQQIDLTQARDCLPALVDEALAEQDVLITCNQQPFVRLVAATAPKQDRQEHRQRLFGSAKGLIRMADDFDEPLEDFRDSM